MSDKGGFVCPRHERFVHPGEQCPMCEPEGYDAADGPYRLLSRTRIKGGWREGRAYAARHGTVEYDVLDVDAERIEALKIQWCGFDEGKEPSFSALLLFEDQELRRAVRVVCAVDAAPGDTAESMMARILDYWHRLIADTIDSIFNGNGGKPIGLLDDPEE